MEHVVRHIERVNLAISLNGKKLLLGSKDGDLRTYSTVLSTCQLFLMTVSFAGLSSPVVVDSNYERIKSLQV